MEIFNTNKYKSINLGLNEKDLGQLLTLYWWLKQKIPFTFRN